MSSDVFIRVTAAGRPPIDAVQPARKFAPVTVMNWPPAVEPEAGAQDNTEGGTAKEYDSGSVEFCVSGFVIFTSTVPALCAGVVMLTVVELMNVTPVAGIPPIVTVHPAANPAPFTVIDWPPVVGPEAGRHETTAGGGSKKYVKPETSVPV
jgi:hypothetical protein